MNISKILSYVVLAVGALGIVLWFVMTKAFGPLIEENGVTEARELPLAIGSAPVNPLYTLTLIIVGLVILVTLISVFSGLAKNPAGLKNALIGIVLFGVIVAIAYFTASGEETLMKDGDMLSANGAKWVGAGLNAFYILAVVAVGAMILAGVKKVISN